MNGASLSEIVERQRAFFQSGRTRSLVWRRDALNRLEKVLIEKQDDILEALAEDLGKPAMEAFLAEYHFLLQEIRLVRRKMAKWLKRRRVGSSMYFWPCRSWIERHPFGVVLVMAPWNYPIQLSLSPLVAAIAAGNCVVLKPSELAPATEKLLVAIVDEVFKGEGACVVTGGVEEAKGLMAEQFDFVFFTGSTKVGRQVGRIAGENLTPALLELGGKCPCVVDHRIDLNLAARRIVAGKFLNAGQTCFAPDFVLVDQRIEEDFFEAMRRVLKEVPWDEEMATIISEGHVDRVLGLCEGRVEVFGEDDRGRGYLAPRLICGVESGHPAMSEEIFGPVLPVMTYKGDDELLEKMRGLKSPLAVYCFSKDQQFVERVSSAIASGSLCINDTMKQLSQLGMPLGGVGPSGHGRYRGRFGLEALTYEKSVTKRYFFGKDYVELMPPYEKVFKWLKKFMK